MNYIFIFILISKTFGEKLGDENMRTAVSDVTGSYPAPPDAKHTPVGSSWGCNFGSKYAGRSSLMPNSSADTVQVLRYILYLKIINDHFFLLVGGEWV